MTCLQKLKLWEKPHILDVMNILEELWLQDIKYASKDGIVYCWRKSCILPAA